jgi:hypothetical protein
MGYPEDHLVHWRKIEASDTVLSWLQNGVEIPFINKPDPFVLFNRRFSKLEQQFIQEEIKRLKRLQVIVPDYSVQYLSPISCIPKSNKGHRLVFDLRHINSFIDTPKFKYEDIDCVLELVEPEDKLVTVDIKDGFLHIPISRESQQYLGFQFEGVKYRWRRLPFGLSSSPYFFCKTIRPIIYYLRGLGVKVSAYVDDFIVSASTTYIDEHSQLLLNLLNDLGIRVNYEKSSVTPSCAKEYIGYIICSDLDEGVCIKIPNKRVTKLRHDITLVLRKGCVTARGLARITGQCVSMAKAIVPAKLLLRNLYRLLRQRQSWQDILNLDDGSVQDLNWWLNGLKSWNGRTIRKNLIDIQLTTDASTVGWGGHTPELEAQGLWTPEISSQSSNFREMMAVYHSMVSLRPHLSNKNVQILSDNVSTVANINFQGGPSKSLTQVASMIWKEALMNNVLLNAKHLAGLENSHADYLSRRIVPSDWKLHPGVFRYLDRLWGPHSIDRCASMSNHQILPYNSWYLDPLSSGVDCLAQKDWGSHNNFVNPPFCIIGKVLEVIKEQKADATLIAPEWKSKLWMHSLRRMSLCAPIRLKTSVQTFISQGVVPEPLKNKHWRMYAWRISGKKV